MPDEVGMETTNPETSGGNESPLGKAPDADDATAAVVDEEDSSEETGQEPQGSSDSSNGAAQDSQESTDTGDTATPSENLKVVVSIRGARATIGVQQPSSDPHIESFDDSDLCELAQEVIAVTERARAKWEEAPKHPAYGRPAPPARRRNRRGQGTAQTSNAESEETQQQTLRLF